MSPDGSQAKEKSGQKCWSIRCFEAPKTDLPQTALNFVCVTAIRTATRTATRAERVPNLYGELGLFSVAAVQRRVERPRASDCVLRAMQFVVHFPALGKHKKGPFLVWAK